MKESKGHNKMTCPRSKPRSRKGNAGLLAAKATSPVTPTTTEKQRAPHFPLAGCKDAVWGCPRPPACTPPAAPLQLARRRHPRPRVPTSPLDPSQHTHTQIRSPPGRQTLAQDPKRLRVHSAGARSRSLPRRRPHALWRSGPGLQSPPSPPGPGRPASQPQRPQGSAS